MLKNIGVENFKIFKDYTEFKLAPITILTGPNNSGKSALNKLLHLIQLNFSQVPRDEKPLEILDFTSISHDLSSFGNSLNWNSQNKEIKITLDFPMMHFDEQFKIEFVYGNETNDNAYLGSIKIFNPNRILLYYKENDIIYFDINYLLKTANENPELIKLPYDSTLFFEYDVEFDEDDNRRSLQKIEEVFFKIELSELESRKPNCSGVFWHFLLNYESEELLLHQRMEWFLNGHDHLKHLSVYEGNSSVLFNLLIINNIEYGINKLSNEFNNFRFISVGRAIKNRVVNDSTNIETEVLYKEFYNLTRPNEQDSRKPDLVNIVKKFLEILEIEGELIVERVLNSASVIYLKQNDRKIELPDLGFGISQLLPILLKVIVEENKANYTRTDDLANTFENILNSNKDDKIKDEKKKWMKSVVEERNERRKFLTFIIEEPEANLHPNLQSKLADLFVMLSKRLPVRFIIETHSEYLIRKLQYLTAKGEISSDDSIIYYFNDDKYVNEKEPKIKEINIEENGGLTDTFGPGFYDETTNLKFDLLKINQEQSN